MSVVGQCPKKPESAYFMSSISILLQNDVMMMTSFHRKNAIQVLLRFWLVFELLMSLFGITTPATAIFGSEKSKSIH